MAKNNNLKDFVTGVAGAIREKKGTTELINPQDFENEIRTIQTGVDTSDATATVDDIRLGKIAYGADGKMTGTIADYDGTSEPASGKSLFAQLVDKSITEASNLAGISRIGDYAFYYCRSLIRITIPNSVTSIGKYAFSECSSLTSIMIPDSVTSIGREAFYYCSSLTSITIPNGVTNIGDEAFYYCRSLASVTIGNGMSSIGSSTFVGCTGLTSVIIGNGVASIGPNVFSNCGTAAESGTTYMILATIPPTIQSSTFSNAKINKIIVPKGTLAAYKSATNWSAYADKIEEAEA